MNLKEKMRRGDFCVGPFLKAGSPEIVEVSGYAGFDFVLLDMEHGPLAYETIEHLVLAAERVDIAPVVRVEAITESAVMRPLDKGAAGILVPHVDSGEMARNVVRFSRFGPAGERGMDMYSRAAQYGHLPKKEGFSEHKKLVELGRGIGERRCTGVQHALITPPRRQKNADVVFSNRNSGKILLALDHLHSTD